MHLGATGESLNNGAVILQQRIIREVEKRVLLVVLAVNPGGVEPFVTWLRTVDYKDAGRQVIDYCFQGHYFRDLRKAIDDYDARVEAHTHEKANAEAIRARGYADGKAAASWLVDGNTPDPYAVLKKLADAIEEGDPEHLDQLPRPGIYGEFADGPTWEDIVRDETTIEELSDDGEQALLDEYEQAFQNGVEVEILDMLQNYDPHTNYGAY